LSTSTELQPSDSLAVEASDSRAGRWHTGLQQQHPYYTDDDVELQHTDHLHHASL